MKYFSLFTGVGGFELGIQDAYSQQTTRIQPRINNGTVPSPDDSFMATESLCVGFSEIDKHASAVLRFRFPDTKNYGDISKINWSEVPDFDLLVGGSPCQDFSIAGKRAGLAGARSGLFGEYVRALEAKKPSHFIWENVKGVLSSNGGRDFAVILDTLAESGYSLWWQVLNAKDFGVPQNRERVFIVGTRNGSPREILFEREGGRDHQDGGVIAGTVTSRYPASQREGAYIEETRHSKGAIEQLNQPKHSNNRLYGTGGVSPSLNTAQGGNRQPKIPEGSRIRRLTPRECERLMSFPDGLTRLGMKEDGTVYEQSDTQRYKQCGNGVVSNVVAEIVKAHIL
jgi:DNA (cytosine-5)-methyltransferase 1